MMPDRASPLVPEPGCVKRVSVPAAPELPVWIYRPARELRRDRVIVAVHGISRSSRQQLEQFKTLADQLGCCLLAPKFGRDAYPAYQQLGRGHAMARADVALNTFLLAWQGERQLVTLKLHLCGYSGGAQFAHRYALLYPTRLSSLVISSAGWYTFPDRSRFPYGLKGWPVWLGVPKLSDFLQLPMLVLVGSADTLRDSSLRKNIRIDTQQGENRLFRARRWVEAIAELQPIYAQAGQVELHELPGQGHDFLQNARQSDLLEHIGRFWQQCEEGKSTCG